MYIHIHIHRYTTCFSAVLPKLLALYQADLVKLTFRRLLEWLCGGGGRAAGMNECTDALKNPMFMVHLTALLNQK